MKATEACASSAAGPGASAAAVGVSGERACVRTVLGGVAARADNCVRNRPDCSAAAPAGCESAGDVAAAGAGVAKLNCLRAAPGDGSA